MSEKDMVKFLMPDGSEVSNDPRFGLEEALQKQLDATEYSGNAGIADHEAKAQSSVEHMAGLQSGQEGVGPNATTDSTQELHGVLGSPAQQRQTEDAQKAQEAGASPAETSVPDAEPVDSNAAVLAARKEKAEAAKAALEAANEEPGDPDKPYTEWTAKQLKAEVANRNADGRDEADTLEITRGMKKADVAQMLSDDDENRA